MFQSVKSDISGFLVDFRWKGARSSNHRGLAKRWEGRKGHKGLRATTVADEAGEEITRTAMGMASPQSACSAGKRSRSATPSTTGDSRGRRATTVADEAGKEIARMAMGMASPQSARSAGKRSRSATPSTTGGSRGHGEWSRRNHSRQTQEVVAVHHSRRSMAGFGKTGLLAANAFRIFPAFIFKNALAANIGNGPAGGI